MALTGTGSSSAYWTAPVALPNSPRPIWMSSWTKGTLNTGTNQEWIGFRASGNTNAVVMTYRFSSANGIGIFNANDALTFNQDTPGGPGTDGVWEHVAGAATSVDQSFFWNGSGTTVAHTLAGPQSLDRLVVGSAQSAGNCPTSRVFAECVFGVGTPTASQIRALAQGMSPMLVFQPGQIIAYYPLRGDTRDYSGNGRHLSAIGNPTAVWATHPPVAHPPRRRLFRVAVGGGPAPGGRRPRIFFLC